MVRMLNRPVTILPMLIHLESACRPVVDFASCHLGERCRIEGESPYWCVVVDGECLRLTSTFAAASAWVGDHVRLDAGFVS